MFCRVALKVKSMVLPCASNKPIDKVKALMRYTLDKLKKSNVEQFDGHEIIIIKREHEITQDTSKTIDELIEKQFGVKNQKQNQKLFHDTSEEDTKELDLHSLESKI